MTSLDQMMVTMPVECTAVHSTRSLKEICTVCPIFHAVTSPVFGPNGLAWHVLGGLSVD